MLNSKQRAYLRSLANSLPALYQVGKDGISDNLVKTVSEGLEANELVKIHVLENSMLDTKATCFKLQELTHSDSVQIIGRKFVLYRPKKKDPVIVLPR